MPAQSTPVPVSPISSAPSHGPLAIPISQGWINNQDRALSVHASKQALSTKGRIQEWEMRCQVNVVWYSKVNYILHAITTNVFIIFIHLENKEPIELRVRPPLFPKFSLESVVDPESNFSLMQLMGLSMSDLIYIWEGGWVLQEMKAVFTVSSDQQLIYQPQHVSQSACLGLPELLGRQPWRMQLIKPLDLPHVLPP
ncbi:hypothetical protein K439DRAFT_1616251 [Ramaria rubella]|nr:hypothetical protein K439DRAFT_1616251 [Ramaria rubella]